MLAPCTGRPDKNLMELARKKLYHGRRFSEAGEGEIVEFYATIAKNLERATALVFPILEEV